MFTYDKVKNRPKLLLAMTSLYRTEFEELLIPFQAAWEAYVAAHSLPEQARQRQPWGGRKPVLCTTADKLLFILFYIKTYPLQEIIAFSFGMSQGQACYWIHVLSPVLRQALAALEQLPERDPAQLAANLVKSGETTLGIDGTERRIQRPKDDLEQQSITAARRRPIRSRITSWRASSVAVSSILATHTRAKSTTRESGTKSNLLSLKAAHCTKTQDFRGTNQTV